MNSNMEDTENQQRGELAEIPIQQDSRNSSKAIERHVMEEAEQAEVAASTESERNQGEKVMKPVEFTTCLLIV